MATHKKHTHTVLTTQTAPYELLEHTLSKHFGSTRAQKAPQPGEELNFFVESATGGPSLEAWQAKEMVDIEAGPAPHWQSGGFCQPSAAPARRQSTFFFCHRAPLAAFGTIKWHR